MTTSRSAARGGPADACWISRAPEETQACGAELWRLAGGRGVIALCGELGTGKTELVKGVAAAAGYGGPVTSPTFTLVHEYAAAGGTLFHVDLYRLERDAELEEIGLLELLPPAGGGLTLIEWAERAERYLPADAIRVTLELVDPGTRRIRVAAWGREGKGQKGPKGQKE